jgi:hypothetical protein
MSGSNGEGEMCKADATECSIFYIFLSGHMLWIKKKENSGKNCK